MTIQPGLRSVLTSSAHELDDFFGSELIAFTKSNGNVTSSTQQYLVYCQSVHGLVEYVKGRRNIQDAILLVGIDGGQGSLKFILSIEDKQETNQTEYKYTGVSVASFSLWCTTSRKTTRTLRKYGGSWILVC